MSFVHLHVHTQYSILDGLSDISKLFARAEELQMPALAITDHGNLYGVKEFLKVAKKHPDIKPIIGCELYVTNHYDHTIKDSEHREYFHLILLAKNYEGYKNLMKIVSTGHIEGKYYDRPRVCHEVVEKYHENLICLSACIAGEVPRNLIREDKSAARKAIEWHKSLFGDDYYLEVQLHKTEVPGLTQEVYERQLVANEGIYELAAEMGIKVVATNDVHFVRREEGQAHDRLICINTNTLVDDPNRKMRYTQQEFLKSEDEMAMLFPNHPEVLENTLEVASKIEAYSIDRGHVLPKYDIEPEFLKDIDTYLEKYKDIIDEGRNDKNGNYRGDEFCNSVAYLCHITYQGAKGRYGDELTPEQQERIRFELGTICRMGFPDYFLIVQDFIAASRAQGFLVGPGRGSAAGSAVAYCIGITNMDPIKYDLLFERFLNPDRISMPDIDVDFEDLVSAHQYVEDKYSKDHVSRVITFGTMAAKSAIKDVARVSGLSLDESNRLSKMVPEHLTEKFDKEYPFDPSSDKLKDNFKVIEKEIEEPNPDNPEETIKVKKLFQKGREEKDAKVTLANCLRLVPEMKDEYENGPEINREVLKYASQLEGSIRQVGVHACATIIGRGNLTDYIPIGIAKDKETGEDVWISQYDGHFIEEVGMLKMDFLGLNTLSIQKECLRNIAHSRGITDIDLEAIPKDDKLTYELFGRGDTIAVFQFESAGMQKYLRELKPTCLEDIIAMAALYRPGPMDYIPDFIDRKQGRKPITYDIPVMETYLKDTYGITVYQEQVMLLSRLLAGFTRGQSDTLRKAMGKKLADKLAELKPLFLQGGQDNGHDPKILEKIWKDWESFASYAFNKSHATCYAWIAYQTAYLKAHFPAEFMAANMSCSINKMDEIIKLMDDCRHLGIAVKGPDINESETKFSANKAGVIRFGLAGIKGVGENVVEAIIAEREKNGPFTEFFDLLERVPMGVINRKVLECMVKSGAFDCFKEAHRGQYFAAIDNGEQFIDAAIRYASKFHSDSINSTMSLFGAMEEIKPVRPKFPQVTEENRMKVLQDEKEVVGLYLSDHPLNRYKFEIAHFTNTTVADLKEIQSNMDSDARLVQEKRKKKEDTCLEKNYEVAGYITKREMGTTLNGRPFLKFEIEDFMGSFEFKLFGKACDTFSPHTQLNTPVLISLATQPRFIPKGSTEPPRYELKITEIVLLGNVKDEKVKEFHVKLPLSQLNKTFTKEFLAVCKKCSGKARLFIDVIDEVNKRNVTFFSRALTVSPDEPLLDFLAHHGLEYRV